MPTNQPPISCRCWLLLAALLPLAAGTLDAATATIPLPALPAKARLALCGDSITEQMRYTAYVEAYLLACAGRTDISVFQFGWGGENADQFRHRIGRGDLDAFIPTAVTIAYGANDGGGQAWQNWMQAMWTGRVTGILSALATRYPATTACTVICSPTWFQVNSEGTNTASVATSNETLSRFRDIDLAMARNQHLGFADLRQRMLETGGAALATLGAGYRFGGGDGVHPGANGHLMIAHEVLKALGCTGDIALITVDMTGGATASAGHTIRAAANGVVSLSSTRYPFCYDHDRSSAADRLTTILPFLPFSQELNRFTLVVTNLGTASANVAWGGEMLTFTAKELAAGVNLTAAFAHPPFDNAFANLMRLIAAQQAKERDMIKAAGDATAPAKGWTAADVAARDALDAAVHAAVVAVEHTITITPASGGGTVAPASRP